MGGSVGGKGCYWLVNFILVLFEIVNQLKILPSKCQFFKIIFFRPARVSSLIFENYNSLMMLWAVEGEKVISLLCDKILLF